MIEMECHVNVMESRLIGHDSSDINSFTGHDNLDHA